MKLKARIKTGISAKGNLETDTWYNVVHLYHSKDAKDIYGRRFNIIDRDGRELYCLEFQCSHIENGNWELVEITEDEI